MDISGEPATELAGRPETAGSTRPTGAAVPVKGSPWDVWANLAVLVPAGVMLGLALWGLGRGTMWRDESATFQLAQRSLPQIRHLLADFDAVHGLYYLVMPLVLQHGANEVVLRLPSAIAATVTAAVVAAIGRRVAGPRVGLWAGLLYAVNPMASFYAQEGRSYALVAMGAAVATLCLVRAVENSSFKSWLAYCAVLVVTALFHEFALLLLVPHAVTMGFSRVRRGLWAWWTTAACVATLALTPLILQSRRQIGQVWWLTKPGLGELGSLAMEFAGPSWPVLAASAVLAALSLLRPLPRRTATGLTATALPLTVLPPIVLFAVSQAKPVFYDRYLLFCLAGVPLLVAGGAERVMRGIFRPRIVTAIVVVSIAAALWWQFPLQERERRPGSRADDLAPVAAIVARGAHPDDGVLFLPAYERHVSLSYPREFAGLQDVALKTSGAASGTLYGEEFDPDEVRNRLATIDRVWLVIWKGQLASDAINNDPNEIAKLAVLNERYRAVSRTSVRSGTVLLYLRK